MSLIWNESKGFVCKVKASVTSSWRSRRLVLHRQKCVRWNRSVSDCSRFRFHCPDHCSSWNWKRRRTMRTVTTTSFQWSVLSTCSDRSVRRTIERIGWRTFVEKHFRSGRAKDPFWQRPTSCRCLTVRTVVSSVPMKVDTDPDPGRTDALIRSFEPWSSRVSTKVKYFQSSWALAKETDKANKVNHNNRCVAVLRIRQTCMCECVCVFFKG